uniref:Uncharacterized protein n=1 Tax=Panagrolaimus davidi TaxID=227884 RepID=A0A914Q9K3_9BILA
MLEAFFAFSPEDTRFVGDSAIFWLLFIAGIIYAINFNALAFSFPCIAYILPITCFIPTVLIASAVIIFGFSYNDIEVTVNDNYTNVTLQAIKTIPAIQSPTVRSLI